VLEHATAYRDLRTRVIDLVRTRDDTELQAIAPAAPEWRIHDVLSHLSGVCADVVAGNLDGVTTDMWTAAQVAPRRDWSTDRLLAEWQEQGTAVEALIRQVPDLPDWTTFLFDAATHEQDIRGALGAPGERDIEPIRTLAEIVAGGARQRVEYAAGGTIRFEFDDGTVVCASDEPAASLRTSHFEVFRSTTGRRSLAQMLAYDWDPSPRPDLLTLGIFEPRATDLFE
jgi:uncharacterized protein (TIGR03083 family)